MTEAQILARTKDVTRRLGWIWLVEAHRKAMEETGRGVPLTVVHKCMGLKKGEKQRVIAEVETVDVRRESLWTITDEDVAREGFPFMTRTDFVGMFCRHMKCPPTETITRIEFRYLETTP